MKFQEQQYLNLIKTVLTQGNYVKGRNGGVLSSFGHHMKFSLKNNVIPILTTKKVAFKTCAKELFWFIRGQTDNSILREQNVHIWDGNGSKEFLESRGLSHYPEHDLGPIYGFQWRRFNAPYKGTEYNYDNDDDNKDQLQYVIDSLMDKTDEGMESRRLIVSAWNPQQLDEMALPPCHVLFQFKANREKRTLDCALYQRSGDVGLGVPFNIASYSLLTHIIAHHCGLKANEFNHFLADAHIYEDHIEPLREQIERECFDFPTIEITEKHENINDYSMNSIKLHNYKHHSSIKMNMSA